MGIIFCILFIVLGAIEFATGNDTNAFSLFLISSIFYLGITIRYFIVNVAVEISKQMDEKIKKAVKETEDTKMREKALKMADNSIYGVTAAKFSNPIRDPRNKDDIFEG